MRKTLVYITCILMSLTLCPSLLKAQSQDMMRVHLRDGSVVEYSMLDVDHVELVTVPTAPEDPVEDVGGTIAQPVDLGLPSGTLWADHNLGATYSEDYGVMTSSEGQEIAAWGTEWSLPTVEQWQELYDNCYWEWSMLNGIEGRLLTSRANGATLFLPASGVKIADDVLIPGAMGLYWSASASTENPVTTIGIYFDSANIYRMEYPQTNGLAVRLVK